MAMARGCEEAWRQGRCGSLELRLSVNGDRALVRACGAEGERKGGREQVKGNVPGSLHR